MTTLLVIYEALTFILVTVVIILLIEKNKYQNNMKFVTEEDSINFFTEQLKKSGFTNITKTDMYCPWDIEALRDGKLYIYELKRKRYSTQSFGDNIMEEYKLDKMLNRSENAYLVSFYTDCWCINNIRENHDIIEKYANKTTQWGGPLVKKRFLSYKIQLVHKYDN